MVARRHVGQPDPFDASRKPRGVVVTYAGADPDYTHNHEQVSGAAIARALAALQGHDFAGEYDPTIDGQLEVVVEPDQAHLEPR